MNLLKHMIHYEVLKLLKLLIKNLSKYFIVHPKEG